MPRTLSSTTTSRPARLRGAGSPSARSAMVAFVVAFGLMLCVAALQGAKQFQFDSQAYWQLGASFEREGSFSLLNFDSPLRGYLLPLVFRQLQVLAGDGLGLGDAAIVKSFNSAVIALIVTVLMPALARLAWPDRTWGVGRRLVLAAVVVVFWRGYLDYPLSDFVAVAFVLIALICSSRPSSPASMLTMGLAAAAAINTRPAYVLLIPVLAALLIAHWWPKRGGGWRGRAVPIAAAVVGFVVLSLPQSLSAHKYHHTLSFLPGTPAKLSALQFTEGLRMQRYDTYVGAGHPPQMVYLDPTGARLLAQRDGGRISGAAEYLGLLATHPATLAGNVGRHVVNGLDARYPTPYVETIDDGSNRWMRIVGFVLVFAALARVAWPRARRALGQAQWRYPAALLLCGASSLASAVETRFLISTYLVIYATVVVAGWPNPLEVGASGLRRSRTVAVLGVALVAFVAIAIAIAQGATANLRLG